MRIFNDSQGREWTIALNVAALRKLQGHGVDLCELHAGEPALILRLTSDAAMLAGVIWHLLDDAGNSRGVSQAEFEAGLDGAAMGRASTAFWEELVDFFRPWRPSSAKLVIEVASDLLGIKPAADAAEPSPPGKPSGDSPGSSGSTPAP